jgi:hypothetical protein
MKAQGAYLRVIAGLVVSARHGILPGTHCAGSDRGPKRENVSPTHESELGVVVGLISVDRMQVPVPCRHEGGRLAMATRRGESR